MVKNKIPKGAAIRAASQFNMTTNLVITSVDGSDEEGWHVVAEQAFGEKDVEVQFNGKGYVVPIVEMADLQF